MTEFDVSEVHELAADLGKIPGRMVRGQIAVVTKGALNVKTDAQKLASGIRHAPHYPRSISYDVKVRPGLVEAEVGPDKDRPQGPLGNILEYGTSKNAPIPHLGPALKAEEPRFLKAVEDLGEDIL